MHPTIVLSAIPMGLSMSGWEANDHVPVAENLARGVRQVADAGADFYICPDNTAHIVLEKIAAELPIPGIHIADVVCLEIIANGWKSVGLLGTKWTMNGAVYDNALAHRNLVRLVPEEEEQQLINEAIFSELCQGVVTKTTTDMFLTAIERLRVRGAECVILGCTEIPIIINDGNSCLPILDTTRLIAQYAVREAVSPVPISLQSGWIIPQSQGASA